MRLFKTLLGRSLLVVLVCACPFKPAPAADALTVVSWGGAYEAAQQRAIFAPFTAQSGVEVNVLTYAGGTKSLVDRAAEEGWDVVDMTESDALSACHQGLLHPLDHADLLVPARKTALRDDFPPGALARCAVAQNIYATVFAYNEKAFPGIKPTALEDFFDLERFPGPRGLQRSPDAILEWALMAEGIPVAQIYDLLSTGRGLDLAFRKLDDIRDAIVWWQTAGEPDQLLRDGKVVLSSGFNGRFFAARNNGEAPIAIVWDGQLLGYEVWAIPTTTQNLAEAEIFIGFATQADQLARLAEHIPYAPARKSALSRIGLHWRSQVPMRHHLPNAAQHAGRALLRDSRWYASTRKLRRQRFEAWLTKTAKVSQ